MGALRRRLLIQLLIPSLVVAACVGCGSTAPTTATPLPLSAGTYALTLTGSDFFSVGTGSVQTGCASLAASGLASTVMTNVTLSLENGLWVAKPVTSAAGSFAIQFAPGAIGPGAPTGGAGVAGTAIGGVIATVADPSTQVVPDLQVLFSEGQPQAALTGGISPDGSTASGITAAFVVLTNSVGIRVTCNPGGVSWQLSRGGF